MDLREFISNEYDDVYADEADGKKSAEAKEEVAARLVQAWRNGDVEQPDDYERAALIVDRVIGQTRTGRRNNMREAVRIIADVFSSGTLLDGESEPLLRQAYPLGTADGMDKALIHWTQQDWEHAVTGRYRQAAEQTGAAAEFDQLTVPIIAVLKAQGGTTGEALGLAS